MSDLIQLTKHNDIAVITINNPPVNALSPGVPEGIDSGRTGYLLPTGDVAGLAARLRELLSAPALSASLVLSRRFYSA